MNWSAIEPSSGADVGYQVPQIQNLVEDSESNFEIFRKIGTFSEQIFSVGEDIVLPELLMEDSSHPTNFVSCVLLNDFCGFLVDDKGFDFITSFAIPNHLVFEFKVVHKGSSYNYKWLIFTEYGDRFIDFPATSFFIADIMGRHKEDIDILSMKDYKAVHAEIGVTNKLRASCLIVTLGNDEYDILPMSMGRVGIYCKQDVVAKFYESNLTGAEFRLAGEVDFETSSRT